MHRSVVEAVKPWIIATIGTGCGFALFFGIAFAIAQAFGLWHGRQLPMPHADVVYWLGFLSGTAFGTTIGMLFTAWWLYRTRAIHRPSPEFSAIGDDNHTGRFSMPAPIGRQH